MVNIISLHNAILMTSSMIYHYIIEDIIIIIIIIIIIDTHLGLKWFEVKPSKNDRQTLYVEMAQRCKYNNYTQHENFQTH